MQRTISDSWVPAAISWQSESSAFGILVPTDDRNLLEFIAKGHMEIPILLPKIASLTHALMCRVRDEISLEGKLVEAAWNSRLLKQSGTRYRKDSKVTAYCQGVFKLPDTKTALVLVTAQKQASSTLYLSNSLVSAAKILFEEHEKKLRAYEEDLARQKANNERVREKLASNPERLAIYDKMEGYCGDVFQYPVTSCHDILDEFPDAVLCNHAPRISIEKLNKRAIDALIKSGLGAPRDGVYWGIQSLRTESGTLSFVSWTAHTGVLPYPEVRWAVQRGLPRALAKPRTDGLESPREIPTDATERIDSIEGFPIDSYDFDKTFDDFQLDDVDYRDRVDEVKRSLSEYGFEALAWYQAYHRWNEDSWGIYFDAKKLDDFALSIFEDLRMSHVKGDLQKISAVLAIGLLYTHEMFHAKVEAATSWNELGTGRSQYLPYTKTIYATLVGSDACLEEALANWSAWSWFSNPIRTRQI